MNENLIAGKLKEIRKSLNIRLGELAERTGLTKGYLSRIENSPNPPPIATLGKIAGALGVDITDLFSKAADSAEYRQLSISRNGERMAPSKGRGSSYGYMYQSLASDKKGKNMEPYICDVGFAHPVDINTEFTHQGEEFIYVLEGRLEMFYKGRSYIMEKGDCAYYDSDVPHSGRSIGEKKAKLLVMIYSYKRL